MRIPHFLNAALLCAALIIPVTVRADDHKDDHRNERNYHDRQHNDDHAWNNHEDQAYRVWAKENHRKYRDFSKLKENDRQSYWGWRHDHSDALLKIDIR